MADLLPRTGGPLPSIAALLTATQSRPAVTSYSGVAFAVLPPNTRAARRALADREELEKQRLREVRFMRSVRQDCA